MSKNEGFAVRLRMLLESRFKGNRSLFARTIGVSEARLRSYEDGVNPGADIIIKIANELELSCDWLLLGKEKEEYDGEMEDIQELIDKLTQYKNKLEKKSKKR